MNAPEEKRIILIVDDVELNRAIISEVLKNEYAVLEAENGVEAVKLMEQHHKSLSIVLLDILMPLMDGFEVMEIMKKRNWISKLPVIMITTDATEEFVQRGYDLGASDVVSKPFNPKIVRQSVNNIVELYRHKNNLENMVRQQMNTLKKQSEKLNQSTINMIDMLSNVIGYKTYDAGPSVINFRFITKTVLTELMERNPEYNLDKVQIEQISEGSLLHDIGKIAVSDAILNKPGRLNEEELHEAQKHALLGGELIKQIVGKNKRDYFKYCYEICRYHHERYDGNGYPDKLSGNDIPVWAQAVSIVDVYDALVNKRSYREAYSHSHAVAMIKNGECGEFNPDVLNAFLAVENKILKDNSGLSENNNELKKIVSESTEIINKSVEVASDRVLWLLEMERRKYQMLSEMSGDIIFEYNTKSQHVIFSENFAEITGIKLINEKTSDVLNEIPVMFDEDRKALRQLFSSLSPDNMKFKTELRIKNKNGVYKWYEMFVHSIWMMDYGVLTGNVIGKLVNIDRRKHEAEEWRKDADTDSITKLLNKTAVRNRIAEVINSSDSVDSAFCIVDLDNFRNINETFGHQFGNEVLKKVAGELKKSIRITDIIGRVGGDEFIIFLCGIGGTANIESKVKQISGALRMDYGECRITGSIGIARYPYDADNFDDLQYKASKALHTVKEESKNGYCLYDEKLALNEYISMISDY